MARISKKKFDLSTAKTADGALPSTSIDEIMGRKSPSHYRTTSLAEYTSHLKTMNLIELQDEAYHVGINASSHRDIILDKLERKFILENAQRTGRPAAEQPQAATSEQAEIRKKAVLALSRGR